MLFDVALRVLFPASNIETHSIMPFDYDSFLRFVLLPFTADILIAEDLNIGIQKADDTRLKSSAFGLINLSSDARGEGRDARTVGSVIDTLRSLFKIKAQVRRYFTYLDIQRRLLVSHSSPFRQRSLSLKGL